MNINCDFESTLLVRDFIIFMLTNEGWQVTKHQEMKQSVAIVHVCGFIISLF